jgi:hypothetical protein
MKGIRRLGKGKKKVKETKEKQKYTVQGNYTSRTKLRGVTIE